jgi:prolipoprotein diacylglyceryltransferase
MLPQLHLYGLAWALAGLLWVICGARRLVQRTRGGCSWPRVLCLLCAAVLAALAGARVHYVLLAPGLLRDGVVRALVLPLADEGAGLRISGGMLAAGGVVLLLGPRAVQHRLDRAQLCDALLPLGGLALALGRLGCFADGCCFGVPCTLPWCLRFPAPSPAYWSHVAQGLIPQAARCSLPVHPLQLYLAAGGLGAFAASALVAARGARPGTAALAFVVALCMLRLLVEPLRESSFGGAVAHQGALDASCALVALVALGWRAQRRTAVGPGAS